MIDAGLVLEGGGMRGIYTAGVLDLLMDEGLWFGHIYGVSAGACHACSYVSRQRGRAARAILDFVHTKEYASMRNLYTTGNYFGQKFVFDDIPNRFLPFDYDTFAASDMALYMVITNCRTGQPEYPRVADMRAQVAHIQATCALPMLARKVEIGGELYMDGGVGDSIPIEKAIADGHVRNLIVLTQHREYRKEANRMLPLIRRKYRAYPEMVKTLAGRHEKYNAQAAFAQAEAAAGRAIILQPREKVEIGRMGRDPERLKVLYAQGYEDAKARLGEIRAMFAPG